MSFAFTPESQKELNRLFTRYPQKVAATLPALWIVQHQENCIPMDAFDLLAEVLESTPMEVYRVATFYTMFIIGKPIGTYHIEVCKTLSCMLCGRDDLYQTIKEEIGIEVGQTSEDGKFTLSAVECMGACGGAPMISLNGNYHEKITPDALKSLIKGLK
jgi:NADH-quinone oxidoreductase subunit E